MIPTDESVMVVDGGPLTVVRGSLRVAEESLAWRIEVRNRHMAAVIAGAELALVGFDHWNQPVVYARGAVEALRTNQIQSLEFTLTSPWAFMVVRSAVAVYRARVESLLQADPQPYVNDDLMTEIGKKISDAHEWRGLRPLWEWPVVRSGGKLAGLGPITESTRTA